MATELFTPGEWEFDEDQGGGSGVFADDICVCTMGDKSTPYDTRLIIESKNMYALIHEQVQKEEEKYFSVKQSADWHNNNTPGVGITVGYQTWDPLPKWVEKAKEILNRINKQ